MTHRKHFGVIRGVEHHGKTRVNIVVELDPSVTIGDLSQISKLRMFLDDEGDVDHVEVL